MMVCVGGSDVLFIASGHYHSCLQYARTCFLRFESSCFDDAWRRCSMIRRSRPQQISSNKRTIRTSEPLRGAKYGVTSAYTDCGKSIQQALGLDRTMGFTRSVYKFTSFNHVKSLLHQSCIVVFSLALMSLARLFGLMDFAQAGG